MPVPYKERDAGEHELRVDLPALLASHQPELAAGTADQALEEWLDWQNNRVLKRMADLKARLEAQGA
jgi:hypothetical protein